MPFFLIWNKNIELLRGMEGEDWVDGQLTFPISFPGTTLDGQQLTLRTSAAASSTFETLTNVGFYLTGEDAPIVQGAWPYLGENYSPKRPDLNGGFEISFDDGHSWTRFTNNAGLKTDRDSWIPLAQEAVGSAGIAGRLGPYDVANLVVRYVIPPSITLSKVLDVQLTVGFEIC